MALKDIPKLHRNNVRTLRRRPLAEVSGALGDLGTLLPLMIALALQRSVSLSSTLVLSGFFNVATGLVFGIPLPVQPMKAIAAAAILDGVSLGTTVAAGALVSAAVLFLSLTGLLRRLTRHVPVPVVKGIQFGAGLSLVVSAGGSVRLPWLGPRPWDNRVWALAAFALFILTRRHLRRVPFALAVFVVGAASATAAVVLTPGPGPGPGLGRLPSFAPWVPTLVFPHWTAHPAWSMAAGQLPLTTLNSVVAASALAADLFPDLPTPTVTELGVSVAAMNLAGCWVGAMPVCHGAGGLAAQHAFGARSGASVVLLGLFKMALGLVFGESLLDLLAAFPRALLGVMVLAAGLELAGVGRSLNHGASDLWEDAVAAGAGSGGRSSGGVEAVVVAAAAAGRRRLATRRHRDLSEAEREERWAVMLITAAGILAFRNDAVGFAAGMLTHWSYRLGDRWGRRLAGEREPLIARG
ncbi:hypothetical protein RB600_009473 [Gaeumannomyces tritici]